MDYIEKIRGIERKKDDLRKELNNIVEWAFPIGSTVEFYRGRGWINAEVLKINKSFSSHHDPSFFIRSHTGAKYWIDLYWIMNTEI